MVATAIGTAHLTRLLEGWRTPGRPAHASLTDRIRLLAMDGRLTAGWRMPAERDLARTLAVSRTTVSAAYEGLRQEGFLSSRQGSGSYLRLPIRNGELPVPRAADRIDLSRATASAAPGVAAAAHRAVEQLDQHLRTDGYELLGLDTLRALVAERYNSRGLPTDAAQILVTSGAQSALSLIARTFVRPGAHVIVESPSYPHATAALRSAGARLVPFAIDQDREWSPETFEATVVDSGSSLALLMPEYHNPIGRTMSTETRERFAATARKAGMTIVVDETTAELGFDGTPEPPPFAAFLRPEDDVLTVGSASKTIWGGLRVGWVRSGENTISRLVAARFANDLGAAVLDQLVVAEMLRHFDPVLLYRREAGSASLAALVDALHRYLPHASLAHVSGGIAAWVRLEAPVSSALANASRQRGLLIGAGPWFGVDGSLESFIRIPITASTTDIDVAVHILSDVFQRL